jgi:hypothetical protein
MKTIWIIIALGLAFSWWAVNARYQDKIRP